MINSTKSLLLSLFAFAAFQVSLHAQCINGPTVLYVGQQATYSTTLVGQCSECYDWDASGGISIVGTDQQGNVTIQANGAGTFSLCVTAFDESGCNTCCLTIVCQGCCTPTFDAYFSCLNSPGHGRASIDFLDQQEGCSASVSTVYWDINGPGCVFAGGNLNGLTSGYSTWQTYGFTGNPNYGDIIIVRATVYFNNGCPPVSLQYIITVDCEFGTRSREGSVTVHKTIDGNSLDLQIGTDQELNDVNLFILDLQSGAPIYQEVIPQLTPAGENRHVDLKGTLENRLIKILIRKGASTLYESSSFN